MITNVLEYLDSTVLKYPDKVCYSNTDSSLTFKEVYDITTSVATALTLDGIYKEPVVVFMGKSPEEAAAFFGVVRAGNYYVPIDGEMPAYRIELILRSLGSRAAICGEKTKNILSGLGFTGKIYGYADLANTPPDRKALNKIRDAAIDADPIYIVFTSGSTGIPKGVIACHRSVIDYVENLTAVLQTDENTIFGNQSPLYLDACLKEVYSTAKCGATTHFIPKSLFMFPLKLVEYLNDHKVNTICWVSSALSLISGLGAFEKDYPRYLKTVAFGSETFPVSQLNIWRKALPDARFINLYGPTEATGMSCYYTVDREFRKEDAIPIGKPFRNTQILLIDGEEIITESGKQGEICIRGTCLTLGYFNNKQKTEEAFVQNPAVSAYEDIIYKTGDLGKYNEHGELVFISRKDNQIKHMGHRIELGEIESAANIHEGVISACCIFDGESKKIILYYAGGVSVKDLTAFLKTKLPRYMIPNLIEKIDALPLLPNGKIDRAALARMKENMNDPRVQ